MLNIKFGDVIYVERDCGIFGYKHFGVYSGDKKVIHYTKDNNSGDCIVFEFKFDRHKYKNMVFYL